MIPILRSIVKVRCGGASPAVPAGARMHSRQVAESALLESEERYRAVIAALEEGIVIHEADGTISGCNASACRILGMTESEIVGRSARDPGWRAGREDRSPFEPA